VTHSTSCLPKTEFSGVWIVIYCKSLQLSLGLMHKRTIVTPLRKIALFAMPWRVRWTLMPWPTITLWQQVSMEVTRWYITLVVNITASRINSSPEEKALLDVTHRRHSIIVCSTGNSEIAFSTARLWMQELWMMFTLQDSQLWPGANRVKSNGHVGQTKTCRYLMNCKKYLSCADAAAWAVIARAELLL